MWFSSESAKHPGGSLLLRAGWQEVQTESHFGDVDRRQIHWFLARDGVNICSRERAAFNGDPSQGIQIMWPHPFTLNNFKAVLTPETTYVPLINGLILY